MAKTAPAGASSSTQRQIENSARKQNLGVPTRDVHHRSEG
jgi:hypothetical protein